MSDSLITKKAMADSLKGLMRKKSLEKITVSDIVQNCGLNRQTFYYHFKDKYDLVNWIYYSEIVTTLSPVPDGANWSSAIMNALNIMRKEKVFYINSLDLDRQSVLHDYLFRTTRDMLIKIIEQLGINDTLNIEPADRDFIAEFYTYGLVGMVMQWAKNGMTEAPVEIVEKLAHFIDDSKQVSTDRYRKKSKETAAALPQQRRPS